MDNICDKYVEHLVFTEQKAHCQISEILKSSYPNQIYAMFIYMLCLYIAYPVVDLGEGPGVKKKKEGGKNSR